MDTQKHVIENSTATVGEVFRQARQQLNLTIEQAAEQVNLRPSVIEHIENNEFVQKNIPATFMKGYVRNYAEFLKLPATLWTDGKIDFGGTARNDLNKHVKVKKVVNPHSSHSRWIGWLTALVVLFVIGMTALWWWENYQQTNAERDNLVQNYVPAQESTPTVSQATNTAAPVDNQATLAPPPQTESAVEMGTENNNTATSNDLSATSGQTDSTVTSNTAQAMLLQHSASDNTVENTTADNAVTENSASDSNTSSTADSALTGDLQIEITAATSWIAVRDSKRHNLVTQKEYKQGEVITLDGKGPYALTIGAPSNVKITYKGENYPLKIDGRVARIKLQ
ncbi:RodZ domain-containing protein [Lonepinella sp. BR2271]|uniref:RodZ domain-containing protein n=1 Tax=Lonepinella sp. BR2271 TaxID=3434550 RepID=UPI003F6DFC79